MAKDVKADLVRKNKNFSIDGDTGDDLEYKQVLASIGMIKDIGANIGYEIDNSSKIHVFEENGFHTEAPSAGANDKKQVAVNGFIKYIDECLEDHSLVLSGDAQSDIELCLSEVLDNAIEHHGEAKPNWRIRGFLSNKHERRTLEISVLNFGHSVPDTFHRLPRGHLSRSPAFEYANKHIDKKKMGQNQLLTVWALQGGESSKNATKSDTRGMGTINLIEAFENIFQSYIELREPVKSECKMNIITGNVVVHFDGKYRSKVLKYPDGSEQVIIPFNESESLESPPDKNYVRTMGVSFPGVMINISLPLKGSVTPLDE